MKTKYWILISALFAFLSDQVSKFYVTKTLGIDQLGEGIGVLPPFLNFIYLENFGINFGLFGAGNSFSRWILTLIPIVVVIFVLRWIMKNLTKTSAIFGGLLIGGALGNVYDRATQGFVTDFINNSLPNWHNPFSYNVADIWVFVGLIGLILWGPKAR